MILRLKEKNIEMEKSPNNINNKIKQKLGGNWGKPNKVQQDINLPKEIFDENEVKLKSKKKRRKNKYISPYSICPFCNNELENASLDTIKERKAEWTINIFDLKKEDCNICGSYLVKECPSCNHSTWYNPKSEEYKHQGKFSCGFFGKKI